MTQQSQEQSGDRHSNIDDLISTSLRSEGSIARDFMTTSTDAKEYAPRAILDPFLCRQFLISKIKEMAIEDGKLDLDEWWWWVFTMSVAQEGRGRQDAKEVAGVLREERNSMLNPLNWFGRRSRKGDQSRTTAAGGVL